MVSTAEVPTYTQMKDKWGEKHFFSQLSDTTWNPHRLYPSFVRVQDCITEGCNATFKCRFYLDPVWYNLYKDKIESENLHPTYPMFALPNGKPRKHHRHNSWDLEEEDIQQTTYPFIPFHPPDFDYGGKQSPFTSTGVLIPVIKTEWWVDDEFDGLDNQIIPTQAETKAGMKKFEWDENLPLKLYENWDDPRLYRQNTHTLNQPLNWLRNGITFLNR